MIKSSKFSLADVFDQIYGDWFGKDVQSDYTYSYVWMANQFGHFGIGFISSVFIFWMLMYNGVSPDGFQYVLMGQIAFWTLKEVNDYFSVTKDNKGAFKIDKKFVVKDFSTDVFFIVFGAVVAYIGFTISVVWGLISFAIGLLPAMLLFIYWIRLKMYFQITAIPYYYRLSSFFGLIEAKQAEKINTFIKSKLPQNKTDWQHILIFGPYNSGKTSLAIGMGTDTTLNKVLARYMSFNKFLDLLNLETEKKFEEGTEIVPWRRTELLIVDNVSTGIDKSTAFNPELFKEALLKSKYSKENIEKLQNQKTIWVIGNDAMAEEWVRLFTELKLTLYGEVARVVLSESKRADKLNSNSKS